MRARNAEKHPFRRRSRRRARLDANRISSSVGAFRSLSYRETIKWQTDTPLSLYLPLTCARELGSRGRKRKKSEEQQSDGRDPVKGCCTRECGRSSSGGVTREGLKSMDGSKRSTCKKKKKKSGCENNNYIKILSHHPEIRNPMTHPGNPAHWI